MSFSINTPTDTEIQVSADPYYPALDVSDFTSQFRIHNLTSDTVENACQLAVYAVQKELSAWKALQLDTLLSGNDKIAWYRQAVFSHAKAVLLEQTPDYDQTRESERRNADRLSSVQHFKTRALRFIKWIQDKHPVTVELI